MKFVSTMEEPSRGSNATEKPSPSMSTGSGTSSLHAYLHTCCARQQRTRSCQLKSRLCVLAERRSRIVQGQQLGELVPVLAATSISEDRPNLGMQHGCCVARMRLAQLAQACARTEKRRASNNSLSASRSTASCSSPKLFTHAVAPHDAVRTCRWTSCLSRYLGVSCARGHVCAGLTATRASLQSWQHNTRPRHVSSTEVRHASERVAMLRLLCTGQRAGLHEVL